MSKKKKNKKLTAITISSVVILLIVSISTYFLFFKKKVVTIPAGTELRVTLNNPVGSSYSMAGDIIYASSASPLLIGEDTLFPANSYLKGHVLNRRKSKNIAGGETGLLGLRFTSISTPDGKEYEISASNQFKAYRSNVKPNVFKNALKGTAKGAGKGALIVGTVGALACGLDCALDGAKVGAFWGAPIGAIEAVQPGRGKSTGVGVGIGTLIGGTLGALTLSRGATAGLAKTGALIGGSIGYARGKKKKRFIPNDVSFYRGTQIAVIFERPIKVEK